MCVKPNQLIFCSCSDSKKRELIKGIKWTLDRFIRSKDSKRTGKLMQPCNDLGSDINIEHIIIEMNKKNCFDFDYSPKEKDCFHLNNGLDNPYYKYFSLIYIDGMWIQGSNPAFGRTITDNIAKGTIKTNAQQHL